MSAECRGTQVLQGVYDATERLDYAGLGGRFVIPDPMPRPTTKKTRESWSGLRIGLLPCVALTTTPTKRGAPEFAMIEPLKRRS